MIMLVVLHSKFISTPTKLENMPDHSGNRTYNLWYQPVNSKLDWNDILAAILEAK